VNPVTQNTEVIMYVLKVAFECSRLDREQIIDKCVYQIKIHSKIRVRMAMELH